MKMIAKVFCIAVAILCFSPISIAQCNTWLATPTQGSKMLVGDIDISGNQMTIEANFNRTQPLNSGLYYGSLVSKHTDQLNANYSLLPNGCEITTTVSGYKAIFQSCPLNLNETYHVAMVYDGSLLKYYRDGFLMSSIPCTGNLINNDLITSIGQIAGGSDPSINQFLGFMNEVRIWNVARTQTQLRAYMNAPLPSPTTQAGLVAYYQFNSTTNKQGNSAFNGTLVPAAAVNQTNTNCSFIPDSCIVPGADQVINLYSPVLGFDVCRNALIVEDGWAFNPGDTVLLIQMKGADIDVSNTASFGTITNYNNSGNYEFNYVKSKSGNVVELKNIVERNYNIPNGKVQLIRVPYYTTLSTTAKLTCLPWDGSKGGVLVFNVQNGLTLNYDIDVSGKGFLGGIGQNINLNATNCFQNEYNYPSSSILAAEKGESISIIPSTISRGKGSPAGGGGGGLDHNSGGGGGGNGGVGGFGGYQLRECNNAIFDNRGIGGKTLTYSNAANKIFLGSGGGAGHANNPVNILQRSSGGNGGGIVIITAQSIQNSGVVKIMANGANGVMCGGSGDCHEGMGGGGAGGTVLLSVPQFLNNINVEVKGGKGADMIGSVALYGSIGPGGGGGGGIVWSSAPSLPVGLSTVNTGGANGVMTTSANNPWGATPGQTGTNLMNLVLPIDDVLFKPNIDSVRIVRNQVSCNSFDFLGFGYTNTSPIASWQWSFGDGNFATTQNTSHTYSSSGTFDVKLIVTDVNGCKDSIITSVTTSTNNADFNFELNVCNPLLVQFNSVGTTITGPYWAFGDGNSTTGNLNPTHTYNAPGSYTVQYSVSNGVCRDTVTKIISVGAVWDNIIRTQDTTICAGSVKQLLTVPALDFCWTPTTFLDNPNSPNPVTSTPQPITYHFTAQTTGSNLIVNGDFSQGNVGFTSAYNFNSSGLNEGTYYVGSNIQAWHSGMANCIDHTTGAGNMMMVNGSQQTGVNVWRQTVPVQPNTNYAFTCWLQHITFQNPATLQFYINNLPVGTVFNANNTSCVWDRFYVLWNSGSATSATIAIVNQNQVISGNDFALDDISFAPVFVKRDSVRIMVDTPVIRTNPDSLVCRGASVQLNATGGQTYSWTPAAGLSNTNTANPIATITAATQYIVTGTTSSGCSAKDTVNLAIHPVPLMNVSNDTAICSNASVQLFASGGTGYNWSPPASLNNPTIPNPVATPTSTTLYYVNITDANSCTYRDSVEIEVQSLPVFTINAPTGVCENDSIQLNASGGDIYLWQPAATLSNPTISNPVAYPTTLTTYSVTITELTCNISQTLTTDISVLPLPTISASKSNDIDCSNDRAQLLATGGVQYNWSPGATLNNPTIGNPVAMPSINTLYTVTGIDANGCINEDTISVKVDNVNKGGYLMPSGFTPNGDGLNDCYGIKYWGVIYELEFSIYNRWGERIFYTTDPRKCWDGTYKGVLQDGNVFVYMIRAKTNCESEVFRKGTFVLIR